MEETYAHELEGQTVVISSMPDQQGKLKPIGYMLVVRLLTGVAIQNVVQVDFEPIFPNQPVWATLTLVHIVDDSLIEEKVRTQVHLDKIAAIVREEKHSSPNNHGHSRTAQKHRSGHMPE